jgi:endogenous inhibitor of DNA gyrase (YacG/DUF329 family)
MYRTIIGLILAAATGLVLYALSRTRYKCPSCGRVVQWSDERCPHCGEDMKFEHRIGPPPSGITQPMIGRKSVPVGPPQRRKSGKSNRKR